MLVRSRWRKIRFVNLNLRIPFISLKVLTCVRHGQLATSNCGSGSSYLGGANAMAVYDLGVNIGNFENVWLKVQDSTTFFLSHFITNKRYNFFKLIFIMFLDQFFLCFLCVRLQNTYLVFVMYKTSLSFKSFSFCFEVHQ